MRPGEERERKEHPTKDVSKKENERAVYVQTCILMGVLCLLCAGMILFQTLWPQSITIRENSESPVPSAESSALPSQPEPSVEVSQQEDKVNLNTASAQELDNLPGVGEAIAQAIVEYREEKGEFQTIQQVLEVEGVGEKTFEAIRDLITVGEEAS